MSNKAASSTAPSVIEAQGVAAGGADAHANAADADEDEEDLNQFFSHLVIGDGGANVAHAAQFLYEEAHEIKDAPEEPFYVHIDVVENGGQQRLAPFINSYMLRRYYFDPRRYFNFFDDVFTPTIPTLSAMRLASSMSTSYYELWKVKANFDLQAFFNAFAIRFPNGGFTIRVCAIFDGEHQIFSRTY